MKVIYLSQVVSPRMAETLSGASIAGNKVQVNVVRNLKEYCKELNIITIYPVAAYPRDKRIRYKREKIEIEEGTYSERVPFINIIGIKQITQIINNFRAAKKYIDSSEETIIFTYNMYPQIGIPAVMLKKLYGCKLVSHLADLPIDNKYSRKGLSKVAVNIQNNITKSCIKKCDKTIVLNKHAWECFAAQSDYIVIDGGIESKEYDLKNSCYKPERKNILYCGSLDEYSGVTALVEAMQYVEDKSVELDIYGDGTLKEYVESRTNSRIHYLGKISNTEMIEMQKKAWVLINPRPIDDKIAQVTFPSKIFEYLMSGVPVITTRLNGFSKDYEGLMIFAENSSPIELARCINETALSAPEKLMEMAARAKSFVVENKLWSIQCKKMADFMGGNL